MLYVPHITFLEFWLLFEAPFWMKTHFYRKSKTAYFLHFFIENYTKRTNNFYKMKETKCSLCTWIFLVCQESCMYHIRNSWVFRFPSQNYKMYIQLYCTNQGVCSAFGMFDSSQQLLFEIYFYQIISRTCFATFAAHEILIPYVVWTSKISLKSVESSFNFSNCMHHFFVSPELCSERDYVITHSICSMYHMYVVCMWYFAKLITISTYIDVFPWDSDTMILR